MSELLTALDVPVDVQRFFAPYYRVTDGHLVFDYGDEREVFSLEGHRVPAAVLAWKAGNEFGRQVIVCSSAMEAIAFYGLNRHRFRVPPLFLAVGLCPDSVQFDGLKAALVFGRDILARLLDIKVAAMLCGQDVRLWFAEERFLVCWRAQIFEFEEAKLSLSAFERASGFRSGTRTYKAKGFNSFLEQLRYDG